jgi:ribosomal protein S12 methylthiotransferase
MNRKTFHLTSLGCAKNNVDSDSMTQLLEQDGYRSVSAPQQASVLVVNTCGFIEPAREESYSVLRALAESKRPDQLLIAAGCLTQRYGAEVARQVPGVDGILGTRRWMDIVQSTTCRKHLPSARMKTARCEPASQGQART